tara:strand:- start:74 stop:757 length:684 start_codon:yes stop_codon:yes gene_type:complete
MSVYVPEIEIFKVVSGIFEAVKKDFEQNVNEENTILYQYFGELPVFEGKFNWWENAKDLFLRDFQHPRRIETEMYFNSERAKMPTVHITLPQETAGPDGLGVDTGYQPEIYNETTLQYSFTNTRMFDTQYHAIITSDNTLEVQLIYHLLRGMLITLLKEIDLSGMRNPKLSGQDLQINTELVPEHIFMRGIGINFQYEVTVPQLKDHQLITNIILGKGKPIDPEGMG